MAAVWCVEDDENIRELEIYTLASMGFAARGFASGQSFFAALAEGLPELVILDVMLPGEDGIAILQKLRQRVDTAALPVIMATARGMEYDKVRALDLGADDYLVKPFSMLEMVSRVRAVLRRSRPAAGEKILRRGELSLDGAAHRVTAAGETVVLTLKEFEILRLFMTHPGLVFSREQLFSAVWGEDFCGETRTVDMHIKTLRQKLGACGRYITTVRGVGYGLEAADGG